MDSNEEVITKRVVSVPNPPRVSTSTVTIVIVLVLIAVTTVLYVVNRNASSLADFVTTTQSPTAIAPQPVPAPTLVVNQPSAQSSVEKVLASANDDAKMQDLASRSLQEDLELGAVVTTVNDARAVLTGAVRSETAKAKAEQVVKAVKGMKSVNNKIVVAG